MTKQRFRPLLRPFFARPADVVARALLGCRLVHDEGEEGLCTGWIVETEAYPAHDPAWRSWGAFDPTAHVVTLHPRTLPFFGKPGYAYLYRIHQSQLLNVVVEREGVAGAVLIRAVLPELGLDVMWARRPGARREAHLADGPGKLCQAFGLDRRHHGHDLTRPPLFLAEGTSPASVEVTPRRGVRFGKALPYRFVARLEAGR